MMSYGSGRLGVAVFGADGRMGSLIAKAVVDDDRFDLVASVGRTSSRADALAARVMVDFTVRESAVENVLWAIDNGMDAVVGTSGLQREDLERFEERLGDSPESAVLVVPNFSIAAYLAKSFALEAAAHFRHVEIVEYYGAAKVDAPSATSVELAESLGSAQSFGRSDTAVAARGADVSGVPVHAVRMDGFVSRQDVLFGAMGERMTISFETTDRSAFLDGILDALHRVGRLRGLHEGIGSVID